MRVFQWLERGELIELHLESPKCINMYLSTSDGFISPEGDFYLSKPSGVSYYQGTFYAHEELARLLVNAKGLTNAEATPKDCLVRQYNWISLSFGLMCFEGIEGLDDWAISTGEKPLTQPQLDTLFEIFKARKLDMQIYNSRFIGEG
jgi:hypothetical protein